MSEPLKKLCSTEKKTIRTPIKNTTLNPRRITEQYETLRNNVLTLSIRNQEYILFTEFGMVSWLQTLSDYSICPLSKDEQTTKRAGLSASLQSQATHILTDMVFYCLEQNGEIL
jgi:hypothetical protein